MKERIASDIKQVYASLISTEGRPTRLIRLISEIEEGGQAGILS